MQIFHWIFLACGVVLLAWAVIRWKQTAKTHPDQTVRRDMAVLSFLLVAGVVGDAVRTTFPERSVGFLLCSAILLPIGGIGLVILIRLLAAYRRSHAAHAPGGSRRPASRGQRE